LTQSQALRIDTFAEVDSIGSIVIMKNVAAITRIQDVRIVPFAAA
jgi:hypothetical protein